MFFFLFLHATTLLRVWKTEGHARSLLQPLLPEVFTDLLTALPLFLPALWGHPQPWGHLAKPQPLPLPSTSPKLLLTPYLHHTMPEITTTQSPSAIHSLRPWARNTKKINKIEIKAYFSPAATPATMEGCTPCSHPFTSPSTSNTPHTPAQPTCSKPPASSPPGPHPALQQLFSSPSAPRCPLLSNPRLPYTWG